MPSSSSLSLPPFCRGRVLTRRSLASGLSGDERRGLGMRPSTETSGGGSDKFFSLTRSAYLSVSLTRPSYAGDTDKGGSAERTAVFITRCEFRKAKLFWSTLFASPPVKRHPVKRTSTSPDARASCMHVVLSVDYGRTSNKQNGEKTPSIVSREVWW